MKGEKTMFNWNENVWLIIIAIIIIILLFNDGSKQNECCPKPDPCKPINPCC